MSVFDRAFQHLVSPEAEGDLSMDFNDPGNWTGGEVGRGELRGTKYGISAAQYPTLNISQLTLDDARAIYLKDYWIRGRCDQLPDALAFCFFDACVNEGVPKATAILQRTLGVEDDGVLGPATVRAVQAMEPEALVAEFQAERIVTYASSTRWARDGRGWTRRAFYTQQAALAP